MFKWLKAIIKDTFNLYLAYRTRSARERSLITTLADALGMELARDGRTARKHHWGCEVTLSFGFPIIGLEYAYQDKDHPIFIVTAAMCGLIQARTLNHKPSYKELEKVIDELCAYLRKQVPDDLQQPELH